MAGTDTQTSTDGAPTAETTRAEYDVVIVGAGISGVAAAVHMQKACPGLSYLIVEAEESFGGTWWTHRFPGIRSDSDLHTFGYSFKPWVGPPIATAQEILSYMGEVIEEHDIGPHIRYGCKVSRAAWSGEANEWRIDAVDTATDTPVRIAANFLWMCQGYYRHNEGYMPEWPGMADFKGPIVHTEEYQTDLDYAGKRVAVIGSGATAATVVPAMAENAAHVTMVQRSPTFFRTGRNAIEIADQLRELQVDEAWIHEISRKKMLFDQAAFTEMCFNKPDAVKQQLIGEVRKLLGPDYDVETHFTPSYRPWRQRIAFVPDADMFKAIADGKASVATGEIESFVENGIRLKTGQLVEADVVVAATGFNMNIMGDIDFSVDGKPVDFHDTVTYRGTMFTGVPNLAWVFGYFRASWTLRSELVAEFVCRLMNHMAAKGARSVTPNLRPEDQDMATHDWIEDDDFNPKYLQRAAHLLPQRGESREWRHTQDYWREKDEFPAIDLDDEVFAYGWPKQSTIAAA